MKKYNQKYNKRLQYVAWAIMSVIAIFFFAIDWQAATGVTYAFAIMVGGVELTGKEEALYIALTDKVQSEIDKAGKGYISEAKMKENIADAIKNLKIDLTDNEQVKKLEDALKTQGLELVALKESGGRGQSKKTLRELVSIGFQNKDIQDKLKNKGHQVDIIEIKAVGDITTGNVSTTTGGIAILDLINTSDRQMAQLVPTFIENFANVFPTGLPVIPYADYIPKEGTPTFIGEGDSPGQVDGKVEIRYANPKKAAGYEVMSEEVVKDIPLMESFATGILFKKTMLKRQNGILFGDGIGDNPTGVTTIAAAFDPASWTGNKIYKPNLLDAIRAVCNQIYSTVGWDDAVRYLPNVIFVNHSDWFDFLGTKSDDAMYVFPQFQFNSSNKVDQLVVVPKPDIPAGKILGGDFTMLNIGEYVPYQLTQGLINEQFLKGQYSQRGVTRFFSYVREYDERAFLYDYIASITAAIEKV